MEFLEKVWNHIVNGAATLLPNLAICILILLGAYILTKVLPKIVLRGLKKGHVDEMAIGYIEMLISIVIWLVAFIMVLDKLGVPVSSLLTFFAALGAAVALAVKDNLANMSSGIVLLFTKPFKAGDFLEVDGKKGVVKKISLMYTIIDTADNIRINVPNSAMTAASILNYSEYETRRQDFTFTIGYEDDLVKAKELLLNICNENDMILKDPNPPAVMIQAHGDSAIEVLVRVWTTQADYWTVHFDMIEKVKLAFDANDINIPYPQLVVHQATK